MKKKVLLGLASAALVVASFGMVTAQACYVEEPGTCNYGDVQFDGSFTYGGTPAKELSK